MVAPNGNTTNASAAESNTSRCYLLELPAELRNRIYGFCFLETTGEVDFLEAEKKAPSKSLLLTWHQVYNETNLMLRKTYRDFWTKTEFVMSFIKNDEIDVRELYRDCVLTIDEQDLQHVALFRVEMGDATIWVMRERVWTGWQLDQTSTAMEIWGRDWFPPEKKIELLAAQFDLLEVSVVQLDSLSDVEVAQSKRIVGHNPLGRDELCNYLQDCPGIPPDEDTSWAVAR